MEAAFHFIGRLRCTEEDKKRDEGQREYPEQVRMKKIHLRFPVLDECIRISDLHILYRFPDRRPWQTPGSPHLCSFVSVLREYFLVAR